jgi:hypothetical protein
MRSSFYRRGRHWGLRKRGRHHGGRMRGAEDNTTFGVTRKAGSNASMVACLSTNQISSLNCPAANFHAFAQAILFSLCWFCQRSWEKYRCQDKDQHCICTGLVLCHLSFLSPSLISLLPLSDFSLNLLSTNYFFGALKIFIVVEGLKRMWDSLRQFRWIEFVWWHMKCGPTVKWHPYLWFQ